MDFVTGSTANLAILVATNFGGEGADKGVAEAVDALTKYHMGNRPTGSRPRRR